MFFFLFKRETAYDMRISDWSSYVCSSDLRALPYFPPDPPRVPAALPTSDAPLASIVIPAHGQLEHTLGCLRALAAWPARAPYEVIVVDDGSPDDSPDVLSAITGQIGRAHV